MFKKTVLTLAAVGLLAGSAVAANYDINIYGASAQYKFWKEAAPAFLTSTDVGCSTVARAETDAFANDHFIAQCSDAGDSNTYTIRVTESKSSEGVNSVQGLLTSGSTNVCSSNEDREMAATFTAIAGTVDLTDPLNPVLPTMGTVDTIGCQDVVVGASDVNAPTFNQQTFGAFKWQDAAVGDANNPALIKTAQDLTIADDYNEYRPIVVPFTFFAHGDVPFDGLSRVQAVNLFAGKVKNWNQFRPDLNNDGSIDATTAYPAGDSLPVILCMRHAGSGTHATLDANVMRGDATLANKQAMPGDFSYNLGLQPETYFNTSSSDLTKCVGNKAGAVGYADSDKVSEIAAGGPYTVTSGKYGYIKKMAFNGYYAERENIINGNYGFWSAQWLWSKPNEPTKVAELVGELAAFAADGANLQATGKRDWWATQNEMNVDKGDDFKMPLF